MLVVTATELPRLMACNGSRLMGGNAPPVNSDDTVRNEGDAAHWFAQQVHGGEFTAEELIDRKAPNGTYITVEMFELLTAYLESMSFCSLIEHETSFAGENWQINSRADRITYDAATRTLYVDDLKFGWGIVEPEKNWSLIAHALGYVINSGVSVDNVVFRIYQPRPHHYKGRVREWRVSAVELNALYGQLAETLSNPSDMLNSNPHCRHCPALSKCPAANAAGWNAIDASEQAFNAEIDNENLSYQLDTITRASEILTNLKKAYEDEALHRIKEGQRVDNYSLDTDLTNLQWKDDLTPEFLEMLTGKDLKKKADLITPTQAKKLIGDETVACFAERRNKGVKLIRVDANTKAEKMFKN